MSTEERGYRLTKLDKDDKGFGILRDLLEVPNGNLSIVDKKGFKKVVVYFSKEVYDHDRPHFDIGHLDDVLAFPKQAQARINEIVKELEPLKKEQKKKGFRDPIIKNKKGNYYVDFIGKKIVVPNRITRNKVMHTWNVELDKIKSFSDSKYGGYLESLKEAVKYLETHLEEHLKGAKELIKKLNKEIQKKLPDVELVLVVTESKTNIRVKPGDRYKRKPETKEFKVFTLDKLRNTPVNELVEEVEEYLERNFTVV